MGVILLNNKKTTIIKLNRITTENYQRIHHEAIGVINYNYPSINYY